MLAPLRWLRRRWLARQPMPPSWEPLVEQHFPFEATLPADERVRFRRHLVVFAKEKVFEGAKGIRRQLTRPRSQARFT
jgi:Mlc titration factor MtfA (ptsG expression regulator)